MAHAFTYQAPYGVFHFSEGLLTVELAEDLIVDLPLMQRVAAQRLEPVSYTHLRAHETS